MPNCQVLSKQLNNLHDDQAWQYSKKKGYRNTKMILLAANVDRGRSLTISKQKDLPHSQHHTLQTMVITMINLP